MNKSSLVYINDGPMGKVFQTPGLNIYDLGGVVNLPVSSSNSLIFSSEISVSQPNLCSYSDDRLIVSSSGMYNITCNLSFNNSDPTKKTIMDGIIYQNKPGDYINLALATKGTIFKVNPDSNICHMSLNACIYLDPSYEIRIVVSNASSLTTLTIYSFSQLIINKIY